MAFPNTTFSSGLGATSALANFASQNGLNTSVDDGVEALQSAVLVNLTQQLGPGTNLGRDLATTAGAGITGGTGTIYKQGAVVKGQVIETRILIDLTGLASSTTDLDIIGVGASAAHLGQITAAVCGTILGGSLTCLEVPAGGVTDIDLYSATEATGVFDAGIGTLTETAVVTSGGAWTIGRVVGITPDTTPADSYLYLTSGAAGTAGTYTAGRFLLTLFGY